MVRALKYHERKLLKKVDFIQWKNDASLRETRILRRYHIADREDYTRSAAAKRHSACVHRRSGRHGLGPRRLDTIGFAAW